MVTTPDRPTPFEAGLARGAEIRRDHPLPPDVAERLAGLLRDALARQEHTEASATRPRAKKAIAAAVLALGLAAAGVDGQSPGRVEAGNWAPMAAVSP